MTKVTGSQARTALALGFSSPIIGATLALIIGLVVFDLTETKYQIWIWVLIQTILGASLVLGTRWSTYAYNYALTKGRKTGVEKSGRNLSFVLSIIWAAVVIAMSLGTQGEAVGKLRDCIDKQDKLGSFTTFCSIKPITAEIIFGDFLASVVLIFLVTVGIYLLLVERGREFEPTK